MSLFICVKYSGYMCKLSELQGLKVNKKLMGGPLNYPSNMVDKPCKLSEIEPGLGVLPQMSLEGQLDRHRRVRPWVAPCGGRAQLKTQNDLISFTFLRFQSADLICQFGRLDTKRLSEEGRSEVCPFVSASEVDQAKEKFWDIQHQFHQLGGRILLTSWSKPMPSAFFQDFLFILKDRKLLVSLLY